MGKTKLDISMKSVNKKFFVFFKNIKERERDFLLFEKIAWSVKNTFENI